MGGSGVSSEVSSGTTSTSDSEKDTKRTGIAGVEVVHANRRRSEAAAEGIAPSAAVGSAAPLRDRGREPSEEEDSDSSRRKRRKKEKKERKDRPLKVKKKKKSKSKDKEKKNKKKSKDRGPVQLSKHLHGDGSKYSVISGKKIRLKIDKTKEDIDAEQKRKDLLASLNEMYD